MRLPILRHLVFILFAGLAAATLQSIHTTPTASADEAQPQQHVSYFTKDETTDAKDFVRLAIRVCIHLFELVVSLSLTLPGHQGVLTVLSEIPGEQYRFERLIQRLTLLPIQQKELSPIHADVVRCHTAGIKLFNAIANTPETIESRRDIRTELERRGLDTHLSVRFKLFFS